MPFVTGCHTAGVPGAAPIDVRTDPAFATVGDAFAANFRDHDEDGAAVVVIAKRRVVVEGSGGWIDAAHSRPWQRDTLVNGFSTGKAWVAVAALRAVATGATTLDTPLAEHWPEFGAHGKAPITLRQALAHRAGLPGVRAPLAEGTQYDWAAMCAALAATAPWWEPGRAHGYHVNSFGFIIGEAVHRSTGMRVRQAVAEIEEIVGADLFIGVPPGAEGRTAEFRWDAAPMTTDPPDDEALRMQWATYANPPGLSGAGVVNSPAWRAAEIPSANGHTTALGLAAFYAALLHGTRLLPASLLEEAVTEHSAGHDVVLDRPSRFGLGFQLTQTERPFGVSPRAYGHFGAGGSLGFADPEAEVAFGYVTASMGPRWQNPRNRALLDALASCL